MLVVVDVLLALLPLDLIQRRLRDINKPAIEQALHLAKNKRQQQRANMRSVDVGIRHDDDLVVTRLAGVECAFALMITNAGSDSGDESAYFLVGEDLVDARFLGVDEFAAQRKNRLITTIASLFRGATGGIALDNVDFRERWIAL